MKIRTSTALAAAVLLWTAAPRVPATAQELEDHVGGDSSPPSTSTARFVPPEERVAAMVRQALHNPQRNESWACLDQALSEMNAPAEAVPGDDSQAKRVSDSLVCGTVSVSQHASSSTSPPTRPGGPSRASTSVGLLDGAWQRVHPLALRWSSFTDREPWILPALFLLGSLGLVWLGRRSAPGAAFREPGKEAPPGGALGARRRRGVPPRPQNPGATALALLEGGLPSQEIARRTGLAQDALTVLLAVRESAGRTRTPSDPESSDPPASYAPTGLERS